jgi:hypothetical protein
VRVNDCDLSVGHNQYGVLIIDALRVDVEGNRIRTPSLPATVFVGTSHDTPEFAARSIATWWRYEGCHRYARADRLRPLMVMLVG